MKPADPEASPEAPRQIGLTPTTKRSARAYYAIFVPLGLLGFAISFYVTYQRNEPLTMPARLPMSLRGASSSTRPPFFEEGPPPASATSVTTVPRPASKRE